MTGLVHSTLHKQCLVECIRTAASVPQHGTRQQTQTVLVSRVPYLYVQVSLVSQSVETDRSKNSEQLAARQGNPATRSISSFGSTTFTLPLYHIRTYYVHMYIHTYILHTYLPTHIVCIVHIVWHVNNAHPPTRGQVTPSYVHKALYSNMVHWQVRHTGTLHGITPIMLCNPCNNSINDCVDSTASQYRQTRRGHKDISVNRYGRWFACHSLDNTEWSRIYSQVLLHGATEA